MADAVRRGRVLVVDDDTEHAATLERLLRREGLDVELAHSAHDALQLLRASPVDVVLSDLVMPGQTGMDLLRSAQHVAADTPIVLMTAFGTVERAVEAMHAGAADFVVKPIRRAALLRALDRVLETVRLRRENAELRQQLDALSSAPTLIGASPAFRAALGIAHQAASSDATVLLLGESGTGKELFAREIHRRSRRAEKPFVAVQCGALPDAIVEAELFGHEAGAFTGAMSRRAGLFEAAHGGTILLDEIGELPLHVQVKLLRVIQEREVVRLGSTRPQPIDVRIVAATHRDLVEMVDRGEFRRDLFYRLNVVALRVPALRERPDDIERLALGFAARYATRPPRLSDDARQALLAYPWPGNIRELQNVVERAVVLDTDGVIGVDDLPFTVDADSVAASHIVVPVGTALAEAERRLILATLARTNGDKALAATILGVGRRTIYRKLDEYAAGHAAAGPADEADEG